MWGVTLLHSSCLANGKEMLNLPATQFAYRRTRRTDPQREFWAPFIVDIAPF